MPEIKVQEDKWRSASSWGIVKRMVANGAVEAGTDVRDDDGNVRPAALWPKLEGMFDPEKVEEIRSKAEAAAKADIQPDPEPTAPSEAPDTVASKDEDDIPLAVPVLTTKASLKAGGEPEKKPKKPPASRQKSRKTPVSAVPVTGAPVSAKPVPTKTPQKGPATSPKTPQTPWTPLPKPKRKKGGLVWWVIVLLLFAMFAYALMPEVFVSDPETQTSTPDTQTSPPTDAEGTDDLFQPEGGDQTEASEPAPTPAPQRQPERPSQQRSQPTTTPSGSSPQAEPREPQTNSTRESGQQTRPTTTPTPPPQTQQNTPHQRPEMLSGQRPAYPSDTLEDPVSGRVSMVFDINTRGGAENIRYNSGDPIFIRAVAAVANSWSFGITRDANGIAVPFKSYGVTWVFEPSQADRDRIRQRVEDARLQNARREDARRRQNAQPTAQDRVPLQIDPEPPTVAPTPAPEPVIPDPVIVEADLTREVLPEMPERARRSGHCIVTFDISTSGRTENVETSSCSSSVFRRPSINAVRQWRYDPKTIDGRSVRVRAVQQKVSFALTDERGRIIPE